MAATPTRDATGDRRSLALLTQQFAEGKSISEQLPVYESIVTEYERISGHTHGDDNKVASILQAVPAHLRSHLQLWITDSTTYEQLKNKVMDQVGQFEFFEPSHKNALR